MRTFSEISPSFWVKKSEVYDFNSAVVRGDRQTLLIDPGVYPDELEEVANFVDKRSPEKLVIVVTHAHWDHVLGPECFPQAEVLTHKSYLSAVKEQGDETRRQLSQWERNVGISRSTQFNFPLPQRLLEHGASIQIHPFTFEVLHVPGHASDQIALYERKLEILWAADMLSDVEIPFVCSSVVSYLDTLKMVKKLPIKILIPGHGNWMTESSQISALIEEDLTYLRELHRRVLTCIDAGASMAETVAACDSVRLRVESNKEAHRMNVETIFLELGGQTGSEPVGWSRYVETAG